MVPQTNKRRLGACLDFELCRFPTELPPGDLRAKSGYYLWAVVTGALKVVTPDGSWPVGPGEIALVGAGHPYALAPAAGTELIICRVRRRAFALTEATDAQAWRLLLALARHQTQPRLALSPTSAAAILALWQAATQPSPAASLWEIWAKGIFWQSLVRLAEVLPAEPLGAADGAAAQRWQRALAALPTTGDAPVSTTAWAHRAALSRSTLHRLCRQQTGQAPHAYLLRQRLQTAHTLLIQTNRTVLDIAEAVGFGSPARFYAACRRAWGCSPGQLRQSAATAPAEAIQ